MRFFSRILLVFLILLVISGGIAAGFVYSYVRLPGPLASQKDVVIPRGTSFDKMGILLEKEGVITHPELFTLIGYLLREGTIKAGEYRFPAAITPEAALRLLESGKVVYRHLTLPEGYNLYQALQLVDQAEGLTGNLPEKIEEGSLFPDTYNFSYGDTKSSFIKRMEDKQQEILKLLRAKYPQKEGAIIEPRQVLTLASIVEKETGVPEERQRIAGLFLNRLRIGMKLQSDPTTIYALTGGKGALNRPLLHEDMAVQSPYNTYVAEGLPPGPICNPGRAALEAVLAPEQTDALYFVADGTGGHRFAHTLQEHNHNVARYRMKLRKQVESR